MEHIQELFEREQAAFATACNNDPEACRTIERLSYKDALRHIGIFGNDIAALSEGYTNLYQQDFLVEELDEHGKRIGLDLGGAMIPERNDPEEKTLYATLIKANMSTFDAATAIADALGIPLQQVSYAGVKDTMAITSQKIALRNVSPERVQSLKIPGVYLHSFSWGKGILEKGKQTGNHFTIVIRTKEPMTAERLDALMERTSNGFYNYYFFQRFGTPRLISHVLGKYLLRRNYKDAVKIFFCEKGASYQPIIASLREAALSHFGDWNYIEERFQQFPYTFRRELDMLQHLKSSNEDFLGALKTQDEQPLFWVYAYASYLFNGYISNARMKGEHIPPVVPLLLNPRYTEVTHYKVQLEKDGIGRFSDALRDVVGYAPMSDKNVCVSTLRAKNVQTKIMPEGVIFSFDLPTGAYATTYLANFFTIVKGEPRPPWVSLNRIDSKELLGESTLAAIESKLSDVLRKDETA